MSGETSTLQPESARLPRVKRLVVVAGPHCAGKSVLIAALQRGELPVLCKALAMDDPLDWSYAHAYELPRLTGMYAEHLVLHYDVQAQRSPHGFRFLAGLLRNSEKAEFLTLQVRPQALVRRNWSRLGRVARRFIHKPTDIAGFARRVGNITRRYFLYRDPRAVAELYEDWFRFCAACGEFRHWVIDASDDQAGWDLAARVSELPPGTR